MDELHITIEDLKNLPNLKQVLLYHVIGVKLMSSDLCTNTYQMLSGQTIEIINSNPCYCIPPANITDEKYNKGEKRSSYRGKRRRRMQFENYDGNNDPNEGIEYERYDPDELNDRYGDPDDLYNHDNIFHFDNDNNIENGNENINIEDHPYFDPSYNYTSYNYTLFPIPDFPYNNSNFTRPPPYGPPINPPPPIYYGEPGYVYGDEGEEEEYICDYGFYVTGIQLIDRQNMNTYTILGNIEAENGVVHVIDRVMIPMFDTIVDIATSFDDYSILVELVAQAGLVDTLLGPGPFTVFAPN
eukprot:806456_1